MKEQQAKTPFFVRFLEQQEVLKVQTDIKAGRPPGGGGGGGGHQTMKYPSDDDEGGVPI